MEKNRQQEDASNEEKSKAVGWHLKMLNNYFGFPDLPGSGSKQSKTTCLCVRPPPPSLH